MSKPRIDRRAIRRLAKAIAEGLFVNGDGLHAERLVLTGAGGQDLGGWQQGVAADVIYTAIERALREVDGKPTKGD